jgi:hypothetical protein
VKLFTLGTFEGFYVQLNVMMRECIINNKGVCHTVALPFMWKRILKAKEELWKLKYFTLQKYNLQKNPLKETKTFEIL